MHLKNILKTLLWIGFCISSSILIIQVFRPEIFANYFQFSPFFVVATFLLYNFFLRVINISLSDTFFKANLLFFAPALTLTSITLRLLEMSHHHNYVYTTFRLDPTNFTVLSLFFVVLLILNFSIPVTKKYYSLFMFLLPLFLYHSYLLYFRHIEIYEWMRHEDSVFEYLTLVVYLAAAIICIFTLKRIREYFKPSINKTLLFVIFGIFTLGSVFVAGEEISWGQRLLGIETPEHIAEINAQEETNLHNMHIIAANIYFYYGVLCLYGMLSWILRLALAPFVPTWFDGWLRVVSPNWYLFLFFLPMAIYAFSRDHVTNRHEELSELFLGVGVLLFFAEHYVRILSYFPKKFIKH